MYELDLKLQMKLILKTKLGRFVLLCIVNLVRKFAVCNSKKLKHNFLLNTISYREKTIYKKLTFSDEPWSKLSQYHIESNTQGD